MQYFKNRIIAKSTPENWEKEKNGSKNNTVRELPKSEYKDFTLFWERRDENEKLESIQIDFFISIQNTETGESFERKITDISEFRENIFIFSFDNRKEFNFSMPIMGKMRCSNLENE